MSKYFSYIYNVNRIVCSSPTSHVLIILKVFHVKILTSGILDKFFFLLLSVCVIDDCLCNWWQMTVFTLSCVITSKIVGEILLYQSYTFYQWIMSCTSNISVNKFVWLLNSIYIMRIILQDISHTLYKM